MGGGSSSKTPQVQTINQNTSNVPEYAAPFVSDMLQRAQGESNRQYTPYGYTTDAAGKSVRAIDPTTGQPVDASRIAGFTPGQTNAQDMATNMQRPGQYGAASDMAYQAGLGALNAGQNFRPGQFNVQQVQGPQLQNYQMAGPDSYTGDAVSKYMSPYMQQVVDVQKQAALHDAKIGQLTQNLGAARQGTYGGARQLLAGTERERNLGNQMGQIQATGSQNAFQNAQQQFNTQQQMQQAANLQNLQANLNVQSLGSGQNMQAQLANQQYGMDAQKQAEQSRQFGANLGLQGYQAANAAAQNLGNLGTAQQTSDMQRMQAMSAAGKEQQGLNQQYLDTRYADFMRQQDYPMQQLSYYNSIIHGLPFTSMNQTQTVSAPPPSMAGQLAQAGLGAAGLYKMSQ